MEENMGIPYIKLKDVGFYKDSCNSSVLFFFEECPEIVKLSEHLLLEYIKAVVILLIEQEYKNDVSGSRKLFKECINYINNELGGPEVKILFFQHIEEEYKNAPLSPDLGWLFVEEITSSIFAQNAIEVGLLKPH